MSFLNGVKMFSSLSEEERNDLSLFCQEKHVSAGDILFKEGEEANSMYFLIEGRIEIYKEVNGEEVVLGEIKAEEILGEMAVFSIDSKRMASARVLEDTTLVTILSFSIKQITLQHPDLMKKIEDIIREREEVNRKIKGIDY